MKACSKCKIEKEDNDFSKNQYRCKDCERKYRTDNKERIKERKKLHYLDNKEEIKKRNNEHRSSLIIKEQMRKTNKKWRENNKNKKRDIDKAYCTNNKDKINERLRQRKLKDPFYKFRCLIGAAINKQLKRYNVSKNGKSSSKYINLQELYNYIESKFEPWMTWQNHGNYNPVTWDDNDQSTWTWQIDHIIPASHFHYTSMDDEDFKKCWALENLRPLSSKQNLLDGNRRNLIDKGA